MDTDSTGASREASEKILPPAQGELRCDSVTRACLQGNSVFLKCVQGCVQRDGRTSMQRRGGAMDAMSLLRQPPPSKALWRSGKDYGGQEVRVLKPKAGQKFLPPGEFEVQQVQQIKKRQ